jgi:hypothetical protein
VPGQLASTCIYDSLFDHIAIDLPGLLVSRTPPPTRTFVPRFDRIKNPLDFDSYHPPGWRREFHKMWCATHSAISQNDCCEVDVIGAEW